MSDADDFREDLLGAKEVYRKLLEASESELLRFLAEAEHVVSTSDKLMRANRQSLLIAIGEAAAARLSINPAMGESYLIPRRGQVCHQVGYKGLVRLMHRSGMIDSLHVDVVYKGEEYSRTGGTNPGIEHAPDDSKRTNKLEDIVGAYAVWWLVGSTRPIFRAITKATIIEAAEASGDPRNNNYSDVWRSHPEAMAWKTAISRGANQLPRSDRFRAFHLASSRAVLQDAGVTPEVTAGLEAIKPTAALPAPANTPKCSGRAAGLAGSIERRVREYAEALGKGERSVYLAVLRKCQVPSMPDGSAPTPQQLSTDHGGAVREALLRAQAKLEVERKAAAGEPMDAEYTERQPGEDRDIDDEVPTSSDTFADPPGVP